MRRRFQALIQGMRSSCPPSSCLELISILDGTGIAHYISDDHSTVLGYEPAELCGSCVFDYVHPDDRLYVQRGFGRLVQTMKQTTIEFRFRHKQGGWVELRAEGVPLTKNEYLQGFLVVANEIVDLTALVEDLKIQALVEGLSMKRPG